MAKSASELLSELERQGLVPPQVVASLRSQVAKGSSNATAQSVADLLVQKGLLTPAQRASLLAAPVSAADLFEEVEPLEDLEPLDAPSPLDPLASPLDPLASPLDPLASPLATADLLTASDPLAAPSRASVAVPTASAAGSAHPAASNPAARPRRTLWLVVVGLLVVGIGGAGAAAAFLLLPRPDGSAEFAAAEADYQAKAWEAAFAKYSAALESYPRAPLASLGRVRRGLAQVHAAQSSGQDAAGVLAVAEEAVLPLANEPALAEARSELAPLLSGLAIELAASAAQAGNPQAVATARQALVLASDGRLVPGDLRNWEELDAAERSLDLLEYEHSQAGARAAVVAALEKAATGGDAQQMVEQVIALRSLAGEPEDEALLKTAYQELAAACQAKVAPWQDLPQPIADERPATAKEVTLVVPPSAGGEGIKVVLAAGSAWGIDRSKGQVLWRRSVGDGGPAAPLSAGGQVFLVDRRRDEVASVDVATGQLEWRLPVSGDICGQPQPLGDQLVVTTRKGGLLLVDRTSGEVRKGATLPQAARTAAIVEPTAAGLWQVADFGLAYRLLAGDLSATEVVPLGHGPASVTAAPVWLAGQLVVAENAAAGRSILHALQISAEGKPTDEAARLEVAGDIVELATLGETLHARLSDGRSLAFTAAKAGAPGLAPAGEAHETPPAPQLSLVQITGLTAAAGGEALLVETNRGTMALPLASFDGPPIQLFAPAAAASLPARASADSPDSIDPAILANLPIDEPIVAGPVVVGGFAYVGTPAGAIARYPLPEPPPEMP